MNPSLKTILRAGFVAGTLDILAAFLVSGLRTQKMPVLPVLKYVASGVFGSAAFEGGPEMPALGLLFHFIIATLFAALYFYLFPSVPLFRKHKIAGGIFYGIVVWLVMNLAVLPLSNVTRGPFKWDGLLIGATVLVLCIGLPISYIVHRHYTRND
ncbi:MAG: DUF1440 domain-containing protein [Spirosomataceae bacterium]